MDGSEHSERSATHNLFHLVPTIILGGSYCYPILAMGNLSLGSSNPLPDYPLGI